MKLAGDSIVEEGVVLVIGNDQEDTVFLQQIVAEAIDHCHVLSAVNTEEALALATERPVDVALISADSDCVGIIEACRRLKADPSTANIRVLLVVSGQVSSSQKSAGLTAGADDFISIVDEPDKLAMRLKTLLQTRLVERKFRSVNGRVSAPGSTTQDEAEWMVDADTDAPAPDQHGSIDAELKLLEYKRQLAELASELSITEDRQRHEIAVALHDNAGQNLAAAMMNLQLLRKAELSPKHAEALEKAYQLIKQVGHDIQTLIFELCPPELYQSGLAAAVKSLLQEFQADNKITCSLKNNANVELPVERRSLVFQAIRELLTNIAKHADASNVTITLAIKDNDFLATVEDDGVGFDTSEITNRSRNGFGLFSIRERLGYLQGRLEIHSAAGAGTKMNLLLPVSTGA